MKDNSDAPEAGRVSRSPAPGCYLLQLAPAELAHVLLGRAFGIPPALTGTDMSSGDDSDHQMKAQKFRTNIRKIRKKCQPTARNRRRERTDGEPNRNQTDRVHTSEPDSAVDHSSGSAGAQRVPRPVLSLTCSKIRTIGTPSHVREEGYDWRDRAG